MSWMIPCICLLTENTPDGVSLSTGCFLWTNKRSAILEQWFIRTGKFGVLDRAWWCYHYGIYDTILLDTCWTVHLTHPAMRRRGDVVTTSLCMSQRRRRYVSNETPNDVSVERRQDVSVVRLHDVLLVCCDDVSRERNDDVPSVRLHDVSNKSQMKHPTTSQWYVTRTSQWYVSTTSH